MTQTKASLIVGGLFCMVAIAIIAVITIVGSGMKREYCNVIGEAAETYILAAQNGMPFSYLMELMDAERDTLPEDEFILHVLIASEAYDAPRTMSPKEFRKIWTTNCHNGF